MSVQQRFGLWPTRTLFLCLALLFHPADATANDYGVAIDGLVEELETWLDQHSEHPRAETSPRIRYLEGSPQITETSSSVVANKPRGLYSPFTQTIFLYEPWNADNPVDQSVLLHELEHHRQQGRSHWYCPGAQELPAYRLQQKWLSEHGIELNVNWVEIVLISGCTRRDIHP